MRGVKQIIGSGTRQKPAFPIYEYVPEHGQPIELEDLPETYKDVVNSAMISLADPDRGRLIIHGPEETGKTFLIIQILNNLKKYKDNLSTKDFFALYMSRSIYNELGQHFDTFDQYVKFVSMYFGILESDIVIFVDHPEIAARIVDSGTTASIVIEASDSMYHSMLQAQHSGLTSVWAGWDTINVSFVAMPRSEYVDLVYFSQKDRLKEVYNFTLRKKHILTLVNLFSGVCSVMTQKNEENSRDPYINVNTALGSMIIRRFAQICSDEKIDLVQITKDDLRVLFERALMPFEGYLDASHEIAHALSEDGNENGPVIIGLENDGSVSVSNAGESLDDIKGLFSALGVNIGENGNADKASLVPLIFDSNNTLAKRMRKSIIGQDEAIELVADSMAIPAAKLNNPEKPLRTFLFLGPTGVGKTELSKVLAKELYKEEMNVIRLDMSEFSSTGSSTALFGSTPGYIGYNEEGGTLTREVAKNPNSLIILDEVEKAHPDTWDAMLQVFDAGRMTTGSGKVVDFSKVVIIMTSNLGTKEMSSNRLGFGVKKHVKTSEELKKIATESLKGYFRPEFLNRIDDIIVFKSLDEESARKIVLKEVLEVMAIVENQGLRLVKPKIDILDEILNISDFENMGARDVQRVIQRNISTPLAKAILSNKNKKKFKIVKDAEAGMTVTTVE